MEVLFCNNKSNLINRLFVFAIFLFFFLFFVPINNNIKAVELSISGDTNVSRVIPLSVTSPVYKFTATGNVILNKDNSYLRIILVDKNNNEYLVYETYPLLTDQKTVLFINSCQETCLLDGVIPVSLKIEGYGIALTLSSTNFSDNLNKTGYSVASENIAAEKQNIQNTQEQAKIQELNKQLRAKNQSWVAGETSVSKLTYSQKKRLFPNPNGTPADKLPNLQGFEYYKGGIFELAPDNLTPSISNSTADEPVSWDWRFVHGENWLTSVKDQGNCGSCWAFAGVAAEEAAINLYYNQHVNFDLSEQEAVSCISTSYGCSGGYVSDVSDYTKVSGISDESCFGYQGQNLSCTAKCNNAQERKIFIGGNESSIITNDKALKEMIIKKGVISIAISSWQHAMALVGFNGRSDWKFNSECYSSLELCTSSQGCISNSCSIPGETMTVCASNFNDPSHTQTGEKITFTCRNTDWGREWTFTKMEYCPGTDVCFNNQCRKQSEVNFNEGYTECSYDYYPSINPTEIDNISVYKYSPAQGDNYWIFKNSWGIGWGENGYVRMKVPMSDFGGYSFVKAPYTLPTNHSYWPAGFDGTVKCVDKDNDTYCNWGISEVKPSICPSFCKPQKDCNDSNPNLGPFDANLNCVSITISPTPTIGPCQCQFGKPARNKGNALCDEVIDNRDLYRWRDEKKGVLTTKTADFNCNGKVDIYDLMLWRENHN